jgi:predicted nucleic acid-binding protein
LLAHYLQGPGAERVHEILLQDRARIGVSFLSALEMQAKLTAILQDQAEARRIAGIYVGQLAKGIEVTRKVTDAALRLRLEFPGRLPIIASVIAATAQVHRALLVHREPAFDIIPDDLIKQMRLPNA